MDKFDLNIGGTIITRTAVYDKLYEAIVFGFLKPGERLLERDLALNMGVSRTPIREAIRQLENERLVRTEPYRGAIVNQLGYQEAKEVYQVRAELEGLAAELVAERVKNEDIRSELSLLQTNIEAYREAIKDGDTNLTRRYNLEFHMKIATLANQQLLKSMLKNLQAYISLLSGITIASMGEETCSEHQRVLDCLLAGDKYIARKTTADHINKLWELAKTKLYA